MKKMKQFKIGKRHIIFSIIKKRGFADVSY